MNQELEDRTWMSEAIREAKQASRGGEVPVGCVVVIDGKEVARGRNSRESLQDPTAHAEILALRQAASRRGGWRLSGATVYVTLEPCPMCAGALVNARVARVVFGCTDPKAGACGTLIDLHRYPGLNHTFEVVGGILDEPCADLLRRFFKALRRGGREVEGA